MHLGSGNFLYRDWWSGGGAAGPSSWPALKMWLKYSEGSGTSLVDSARPPEATPDQPLFGPLTIQTAAGSGWGTSGAFTTLIGTPFTGDTHALSASAFSGNALTFIGTKSIILELDATFNDTDIDNYACAFAYGAARGSTTFSGVRLRWVGPPNYNWMKFVAAGTGGGWEALFAPAALIVPTARHHYVFIWDRGASSTGFVDLWIDGGFFGTYVFGGDPGAITLSAHATYNRLGVGYQPGEIDDGTTGLVTNYNTRLWALTGAIPDAAAIVAALYADTETLPAILQGRT